MGLFDMFKNKGNNDAMKNTMSIDAAAVRGLKKEQIKMQGVKTPGENSYEANRGLLDAYRIYRADSILKQTVQMYVELALSNGFSIVSKNSTIQKKIMQRISEIEFNSNTTLYELIRNQMLHYIAFANAFIVFQRNKNNTSGNPYVYNGRKLEPISGMFVTHPITIGIHRNQFGEAISYKQDISLLKSDYNFFMGDPELNFLLREQFGGSNLTRKFDRYNVAHFKFDEDLLTGFGRPFYFEAIDDLLILRKVERIIEEIIDKGSIYQAIYKVGTEKAPVRSQAEVDNVKEMLERAEPYSVVVMPYNHSMEMKSNNVLQDILVFYDKIRHRVYGALGLSSVMMGEAGQANRATAETSVNFALLKAKEFQKLFAAQFQHEVLEHILIDLGYNPKKLGEDMPRLEFNDPDIDTLIKYQNHAVYLYEHSAIPFAEMRERLGLKPTVNEEDMYIYKVKMPLIEKQAELKMSIGANAEPENGQETENKVNPQNQYTKNS